jgi:hypothetical protein
MKEQQYRDAQLNEQRVYVAFDLEHGRYKGKPPVQMQVNEAVRLVIGDDEKFNTMVAERVAKFEEAIIKLYDGKIKSCRDKAIKELNKVEGLGDKVWNELMSRTYPTVEGGVDEKGD